MGSREEAIVQEGSCAPLAVSGYSTITCQFSSLGEVGEGVLGNTAKEGARAWGLGRLPPPPFHSWLENGECLRRKAGRLLEGAEAELLDTPLFQGSHLPGLQGETGEEGWGKPELAKRETARSKSREVGAKGGRGRIGKGCA